MNFINFPFQTDVLILLCAVLFVLFLYTESKVQDKFPLLCNKQCFLILWDNLTEIILYS